jgi:hypothetical protein
MLEKIGTLRRPLNPELVDKLFRYAAQSLNSTAAMTQQQCVHLKNALATHTDLEDRFRTIIDINKDKIEITHTSKRDPSVPHSYGSSNGSSTSGWGDIFLQMSSCAGVAAASNQKFNANAQSKAQGMEQHFFSKIKAWSRILL